MLVGSTKADRQGWHYACPSPLRLLTSSSFIHIDNTVSTWQNEDAVGEPDGRRVYGACKAASQRNFGLSVLILVVGAGGTVFFALRHSQEQLVEQRERGERAREQAQLEAEGTMLRLGDAAELVGESPRTVVAWAEKSWVGIYFVGAELDEPRLLRDELLAVQSGQGRTPTFTELMPDQAWLPDADGGQVVTSTTIGPCETCRVPRHQTMDRQGDLIRFTCSICHTGWVHSEESLNRKIQQGFTARSARVLRDALEELEELEEF